MTQENKVPESMTAEAPTSDPPTPESGTAKGASQASDQDVQITTETAEQKDEAGQLKDTPPEPSMSDVDALLSTRLSLPIPYEDDEEESKWVYRSDPNFAPRQILLNDEPFTVELGLSMQEAWEDVWDKMPDYDIPCKDYCALKDIYFYSLERTFFFRFHWLKEDGEFPLPKRITFQKKYSESEEFILQKCDVYGQAFFDDGSALDVRGFGSFPTEPDKRAAIQRNQLRAVRESQNASQVPQPSSSEEQQKHQPPSPSPEHPLQIGPLKIHEPDWSKVSLNDDGPYDIGGQIPRILKAFYDLGATSPKDAKSTSEIYQAANIKNKKPTLANLFSSGGNKAEFFMNIFKTCIGFVDSKGRVIEHGSRQGIHGGKYFLKNDSP